MCNGTIQFSPAMTNYFEIVPPSLYPLFTVVNRLIVALEMALVFIYASLIEEKKKMDEENGSVLEYVDDNKNNILISNIVKNDQTEKYSFVKGLFRLSFSIYMSNYLFIRTDFLTTRKIFYNSLYVYVSFYVSLNATS